MSPLAIIVLKPETFIASTVQYSTVQYSTVQYSTVQYSTGKHLDPLIGFSLLSLAPLGPGDQAAGDLIKV